MKTSAVIGGAVVALALLAVWRSGGSPATGTWVPQSGARPGQPASMTIDAWRKSAIKLSYRITEPETVISVDSPADGTDVPTLVNGRPKGQAMAITLVDPHHAKIVIKQNGKRVAVSNAIVSADGKTLTLESDVSEDGTAAKMTDVWVRK